MRVGKSVRVLALLLCLSLMTVPVKVSAYDYVERPTLEYYDNEDLKNVTFKDGSLIRYNSQGGHIVIMTNRLRSVVKGTEHGDFTDYGFYGKKFKDFAAVNENDRLNRTFGIVAHTDLLPTDQSSISISLPERVISKSNPGIYYIYLWTQYKGYCYPDQLLARIKVTDTNITVDPATSINACNDERYFYIAPPAHMTRDTSSGAELQEGVVIGSDIVSVIYTANEGYYFPKDYTSLAPDGITVTWNSEKQITVSGTLTTDTKLTLREPTAKPATYTVTVIPAAYMTRKTDSGLEKQSGLTGAMTEVVYTAEDGYYFPESYSVSSENGIKVTRKDDSQITVSGTPTANTVIQLTAPTAKPATYTVTVTPAEHMTRKTDSGLEKQSGLTGAMTEVVYTADEGYYFPDSYPVPTVNGITVTRNGENQITVSGTPTANTEIKLMAPTEKTPTPPSTEPAPATPAPATPTPVPATPTPAPSNNNSNNDSDNSSDSQVSQATATPAPTPEAITYAVQKGDSLWKIARRNGCSLQALMEANKELLKNSDRIYPNQKLIIPTSDATPNVPLWQQPAALPNSGAYRTYKVQKGDSLWKIAHENGCSLEELIILNNISADRVKLIYPGWELLIPEK